MIEKIDGKTRFGGVMGNPIAHTMSPLIHNTLAGKLSHNFVYLPLHVEQDLASAVKGAYALNVLGMNVTVPYKSEVIKSLVDIDEAAAKIGAVNTLVRVEGGYKGYNTDYLGLKRSIEEDGITIEGKPVLLFGAGGAAKAAACLAGAMKAKELYIINRTVEKAQELASYIEEQFGTKTFAVALTDVATLPKQTYTAIQTTNWGMWPNTGVTVLNEDCVYEMIDEAVDIIFNPPETEFMKRVKAHGGKAINGLKMLLYQGVTAYEFWHETKVDEALIKEVHELLEKEFENHE